MITLLRNALIRFVLIAASLVTTGLNAFTTDLVSIGKSGVTSAEIMDTISSAIAWINAMILTNIAYGADKQDIIQRGNAKRRDSAHDEL